MTHFALIYGSGGCCMLASCGRSSHVPGSVSSHAQGSTANEPPFSAVRDDSSNNFFFFRVYFHYPAFSCWTGAGGMVVGGCMDSRVVGLYYQGYCLHSSVLPRGTLVEDSTRYSQS
jgi:hypothetical protein